MLLCDARDGINDAWGMFFHFGVENRSGWQISPQLYHLRAEGGGVVLNMCDSNAYERHRPIQSQRARMRWLYHFILNRDLLTGPYARKTIIETIIHEIDIFFYFRGSTFVWFPCAGKKKQQKKWNGLVESSNPIYNYFLLKNLALCIRSAASW